MAKIEIWGYDTSHESERTKAEEVKVLLEQLVQRAGCAAAEVCIMQAEEQSDYVLQKLEPWVRVVVSTHAEVAEINDLMFFFRMIKGLCAGLSPDPGVIDMAQARERLRQSAT